MAEPHSFARELARQLHNQPADAVKDDLPAYDYADARRVADELATDSVIQSFRLGTGASVFASAILPAVLAARKEVILVTCFWAPSKSLRDLSQAIARIAEARQHRQGAAAAPNSASGNALLLPPLRIRICLSSRTLFQKLFHTSSRDGYVYPPATWATQLGLPSADVLQAANIDLAVKSLFFLPFSVMHPKYVLVDRERAFLPSCNVSWEPWLEGCVEVTGAAVAPLLSFYGRTWGDSLPALPAEDIPSTFQTSADNGEAIAGEPSAGVDMSPLDVDGPGSIAVRFYAQRPVPTVILPSSHHRNPVFRPFPWQDYAPPPPTPLNLAMLHLFATAQRHIYVNTPNLTAEAAIAALLGALSRGVDVSLVTGESMMVWEQILTAFTTTARCVQGFIKRYEALRSTAAHENRRCGVLRISYYKPIHDVDRHAAVSICSSGAADDEEAVLAGPRSRKTNTSGFDVDDEEPVLSHVKLTIVDGRHTVLGSGNMDRASWFTSQELGILFHDAGFATQVQTAVDRVLEGRLVPVYPASS